MWNLRSCSADKASILVRVSGGGHLPNYCIDILFLIYYLFVRSSRLFFVIVDPTTKIQIEKEVQRSQEQ